MVRGLGAERFGILALLWGVLGGLTLFDLGLGKATTKFAAQLLGSGDTYQLPSLVWTSVLLNTAFSLIVGLFLLALTPLLVGRFLHLSPAAVPEARTTFQLVAPMVFVVMASSPWSGLLEAGQHYALVNTVKVPTSSLNFLIPVVGVYFGFGLPVMVLLMLVTRTIAAGAYLALSLKSFPLLRRWPVVDRAWLRQLFGYGRWVALSNGLWPCMMYLDRFLIANLISVGEVTFYAAPYEMLTRLWILPTSLGPLFPAFSALGSIRAHEVADLYARANKYLLLILGPLVAVIAVFAGPFLGLWLGAEFRHRSTAVVQILVLGVLAISFASVADSLAKGLGWPDITAKLHLVELPLYGLTAWLLIRRWGIVGAAVAFTLRAVVDLLLMFRACRRILVPTEVALRSAKCDAAL